MAKKQFKAESKRLLDLMINSIYTNKEIFLREIISNASDAIDKLCYLSLTDDTVGLNRDDFRIDIILDKTARTITVRDNGIGMTWRKRRIILASLPRAVPSSSRVRWTVKRQRMRISPLSASLVWAFTPHSWSLMR